ncbi:MAG: beta-ketoacyl-ACP synthase III [Atopobiaceae bacterium]
MAFTVVGTGSALPNRVVTNDELSTFIDTTDEWIQTRTGIATRHVCTDETLDDLAVEASKKALDAAGMTAGDLDLIVCSTTSGDHLMPAEACAVAERIGAHCPAFDVSAACAGFIFALDAADGWFCRNRAKTALVLSAEKMSRLLDWEDRSTCVLFGDGAGAAVVTAGGESPLWSRLVTKPDVASLDVPGLVGTSPFGGTAEARPSKLLMKGRKVFHFAVSSIEEELDALTQETGTALSDIDHFIFHQANERILDAVAKRCSLEPDRIVHTIKETGNISSACIPLALDRMARAGKLRDGDLIVLCGFGAGLDIATALIRWKA